MTRTLTKLASATKVLSSQSPRLGPDAAAGIEAMFQAWRDYQQVHETESTKREEIRARSGVEITRLREQAQLIREHFAMIFSERRDNFDKSFTLLETGLSNGDDRQIEAALTLIVTLVKEWPIKQAAETMRTIKERVPGQIIDL